ncbi:MAG: hypothetical protein PHI97_28520 [Desulfobulbus sp.]|nr:hypothetical protein [Desulfobulbus sp.]
MARTVHIRPDEVLKAKKRIALLTLWASVAARFFVIEIKFAVKMARAKIHGAVAGMHL